MLPVLLHLPSICAIVLVLTSMRTTSLLLLLMDLAVIVNLLYIFAQRMNTRPITICRHQVFHHYYVYITTTLNGHTLLKYEYYNIIWCFSRLSYRVCCIFFCLDIVVGVAVVAIARLLLIAIVVVAAFASLLLHTFSFHLSQKEKQFNYTKLLVPICRQQVPAVVIRPQLVLNFALNVEPAQPELANRIADST